MEIQEQLHGAVTVVRPKGALTQDDAETLRERLLATSRRTLGRVVVDVSAVPFLDSAGLEALVEVTEQLGHSGQALKLTGTNELVREILELTDIASMFDHYADVNSAVRSFL